jgi:hypothetical protein
MFRYSAPGTIDLRTGGSPYFSVDGGATALFGNTYSTGQYNGDGRQASHWKDTSGCQVGNGIMDPTFCFGHTGVITGLDLAALPQPTSVTEAASLTWSLSPARGYSRGLPIPIPKGRTSTRPSPRKTRSRFWWKSSGRPTSRSQWKSTYSTCSISCSTRV